MDHDEGPATIASGAIGRRIGSAARSKAFPNSSDDGVLSVGADRRLVDSGHDRTGSRAAYKLEATQRSLRSSKLKSQRWIRGPGTSPLGAEAVPRLEGKPREVAAPGNSTDCESETCRRKLS